jgi:glutamate racemase
LIKQNVDCLVLGCTHYPYLIPQIRNIVGTKIQIIDSGEAVARQTKAVLKKNELTNTLSNQSEHQFYINTNKKVLELLVDKNTMKIKIERKDF